MKSLLVKAVAPAIAIGTLASCSSSLEKSSAANSKSYLLGKSKTKAKPIVLTKARAQSMARNTPRSAPVSKPAWSSAVTSSFLPASVDVAVKSSSASLPKDKHGRPTYHSDSARHRYVRTTAYSHQENEPGAPGRLNAIGTTLKYGQVRSAAADWSRYPVGTTFKIKGLPHTYVIDDYGSALVGTNTIDIFHPTLSSMRRWATRDVEISIIRWGSLERTTNLLRGRTKYGHCRRMYHAAMSKINRGRVASTRTGATDQSL